MNPTNLIPEAEQEKNRRAAWKRIPRFRLFGRDPYPETLQVRVTTAPVHRVLKRTPPMECYQALAVTSHGFLLRTLARRREVLDEHPVFLFETPGSLEVALGLSVEPVRYAFQLVHYPKARRALGRRFRWWLMEGLLDQAGRLRERLREAPLKAESSQAASRLFNKATADLEPEELVGWKSLDPHAESVENAKWIALRDWHRKSLKLFTRAEGSAPTGEDLRRVLAAFLREFSIEMKAGAGIELPWLRQLSPRERKSLTRRQPKIRPEVRELARNWIRCGYDQMRPAEYAAAVFERTGVKLSPANAKVIARRLGLLSRRLEELSAAR